jgi:hypothetical protein
MIPQPFVKGSSERVFFGPYEYPAGADLIFDFGNPLCTSAFNSGRIVYNAATQNVTGSLIPYNNPGIIYPTLSTNNGGVMITEDFGFSLQSYLQWNWKSTEQQSSVIVYAPNGAQNTGANQFFPKTAGASSIELQIIYPLNRLFVSIANSSNVVSADVFGVKTFDTGSLNGQNGWNTFAVTADASSNHRLYINTNSSSFDSTPITRTTSATQTTNFSFPANARIMAFMQYPRLLTPKEIRQINKVFAQRFFT